MYVVRVQEGQKIQVGDRLLEALSIISPGVVSIGIDGEDQPVTIAWDRKLEVFPGVMLTVDRSSACYSKRIRFLFEAPRSIWIRELPYEPVE